MTAFIEYALLLGEDDAGSDLEAGTVADCDLAGGRLEVTGEGFDNGDGAVGFAENGLLDGGADFFGSGRGGA